jgi:hypothetical protein
MSLDRRERTTISSRVNLFFSLLLRFFEPPSHEVSFVGFSLRDKLSESSAYSFSLYTYFMEKPKSGK